MSRAYIFSPLLRQMKQAKENEMNGDFENIVYTLICYRDSGNYGRWGAYAYFRKLLKAFREKWGDPSEEVWELIKSGKTHRYPYYFPSVGVNNTIILRKI